VGGGAINYGLVHMPVRLGGHEVCAHSVTTWWAVPCLLKPQAPASSPTSVRPIILTSELVDIVCVPAVGHKSHSSLAYTGIELAS